MSPSEEALSRQGVRSYARRCARMTGGQARGFEQGQQFLLPEGDGSLDWHKVFGCSGPVVLEVGFGMGDSLFAQAKAHPEFLFVGSEVYQPGVGSLLRQLVSDPLPNLRIVWGDVLDLVPRIRWGTCDRLQCFFPDPWPKARHQKRRLLQGQWLENLLPIVCPGGAVWFVTDDDEYGQPMEEGWMPQHG